MSRKQFLKLDLQQLEEYIFLKYQEIVSNMSVQKTDMIDDRAKFKADIVKHGQQLHREIDFETQKIKSLFNEMDKLFLTALSEQEDKIRQTISKIKECISDIKLLLKYNDVRFISAFKSRNADFRGLPLKWNITFPKWTSLMINRKLISQQFHRFLLSLKNVYRKRILKMFRT